MKQTENRNPKTGLTSQQEEAINMLIAGESVKNISERLEETETTIYQWQEQITFNCYYNKKCKAIKANINDSLLAMYEKALNTISSCMQSDNEAIRLKSATWLIEKVSSFAYGNTNPVEVFRKECTEKEDWGFPDLPFNENKFKQLLAENGLKEG